MVLTWMTYMIIKKKYRIDEEVYDVILSELKRREEDPGHFDISALAHLTKT
jgi:hypothetical protein